MKTYRALTRTFVKSISMSKPATRRARMTMGALVAVVVMFIFIPVAVFCAVGTYALCNGLSFFGIQDLGLAMVFHLICLFTLFFGFNVIFNEFYFSSDIDFVRPWPVKAWELVAAKFTVSYYVDNAMQIFMVIASLAGFFYALKPGFLSWLSGILAIITLPIVPLCYCGIISILVMKFTNFIKNKESVQRMSAFVTAALLLGFALSFQILSSKGMDAVSFFFTTTNSPFVEYMNRLFPTIHFISRAIAFGSITDLLIYILINVAFVALQLFLAEVFYFDGFINLANNKKNKMRSLEQMLADSKQQSPAKAYFMKELRILFRTPAFFTNSVIVNLLWPIFVLVILKFQTYDASIHALQIYNLNRPKTVAFFLIIGSVVFSLVMTAINSLSSNAISREGKHFQFMKYIPVSYDMQWDIKALVSIVLTYVGIWIYMLPLGIIVHVKFYYILTAMALSFLSVTFVSYFGLYLDSVQPKLVWDDEMSVNRENTNVALNMGITLMISLVIGAFAYFFFAFFKVRLVLLSLILFVLLAVLNLLAILKSTRKGKINIATQEEM